MQPAYPPDPHAPPPRKGMPWWGILLFVLGGLFLLGALAIGGFVYWLSSNKERFIESGKRAKEEAQAFAATHDQNECVDEALGRLARGSGIMAEAETKLFLQDCLLQATETPGFCDGVPKRNDIMKAAVWATGECERRYHGNQQACGRLMQAVPETCDAPARR